MISRRKFLSFFGVAVAAPVVAKVSTVDSVRFAPAPPKIKERFDGWEHKVGYHEIGNYTWMRSTFSEASQRGVNGLIPAVDRNHWYRNESGDFRENKKWLESAKKVARDG